MTGRLANVALRDDTDRRAYAAHHLRLNGASLRICKVHLNITSLDRSDFDFSFVPQVSAPDVCNLRPDRTQLLSSPREAGGIRT
jgi:hypothetical protein